MLSRLPTSLQQHLLLEWLSPEAVFRAASAIDAVRTCVVESPPALVFRAADGEVLTSACIEWFRAQGRTLHLWTHVTDHNHHYSNGKFHRDGDLPAVIYPGHYPGDPGARIWFQHGKRHRDGDKPAFVLGSVQYWYQHGVISRDGDKPAYVSIGRMQVWYQKGVVHRDGDKPATVDEDGSQTWCQNGKYHRDGDEPAIILASGTRKWCQRGRCHRDGDRPAMVLSDGSQMWFQHGKLHREDGKPAIIWSGGTTTTREERWMNGDPMCATARRMSRVPYSQRGHHLAPLMSSSMTQWADVRKNYMVPPSRSEVLVVMSK